MNRSPRALLLLTLWVAALATLGWFVQRALVLGTDLRLFLPSPATPAQRLLLEEIGEGPAARVLVIALDGAPPAMLADASRALAESLRESAHFRFVTNGETPLDAVPESLLTYRYLLSPTLDTRRFDADYLRAQIEARARDLASPAGAFLEPWLPRDPTLELLNVLQRWQPMQEPRREFDVWFDRAARRALLLAETQAAAFDPERQRIAIDELRAAFARANEDPDVTMFVSGSGKFSVLMEERTRGDAERLGTLAAIGMILILLIAYRRAGSMLLSALPLASAGLTGLAAVSVLFGEVHGITLAFGFTLIGVAQDYPIHLLSHRRPDRAPTRVAHDLWPTLATGVASTCIAYFTFLFSGVVGLQQLACFTVVGLAVAGFTTRFALPALMDSSAKDHGASRFLDRTQRTLAGVPRPRWLAAALIAVCLAMLASAAQPFWENDLGKLTPVPADLLAQDQALRTQLGAADLRYMLVVDAADEQAALQRLESLDEDLEQLIATGAITGYAHAARYAPSAVTQRRRQQRLPQPAKLRAALQSAVASSPFRPAVFEPFLDDVAQARTLPPLRIAQLRDTPLGASLDILLRRRDQHSTALVTFSGVSNPAALQQLAAAEGDGVMLLDLKEASESLVVDQRERMLWSLAVAAALLIAVVSFSLRDVGRVSRVIAPMALTTLIVVAVLQAAGVSLTLFHLIALILAAGLGLDYALFFEHAANDPAEQRRTLHAILVCSLSTLMVFALLGTSSLPVLRAIGVTVSIGVIANFILAALITQRRAAPEKGSGCWALGSGTTEKKGSGHWALGSGTTEKKGSGHWALGSGKNQESGSRPSLASAQSPAPSSPLDTLASAQSPAPSSPLDTLARAQSPAPSSPLDTLASAQSPAPSSPLDSSPLDSSPLDSSPSPASLIPHSGSMCLLERIIEWDDERIVLESHTHRSPLNPLRVNNRLRAVHLCEYGAQAMAVHGALQSRTAHERASPGMLVSLRAVSFTRDYIEDLPGALRIEAQRLQASESSLQYGFRVTHAGELLAEGRAAVVLR